MKVEHAFLPKGELVLLIHVQSEEDRRLLKYILIDGYFNDSEQKFADRILSTLDSAKEFFKPEEKK